MRASRRGSRGSSPRSTSFVAREESDRQDEAELQADQDRLRAVQVELDRCWDLLRQRRGREEFGLNPDEAQVRDSDTVQRYLQ